MIKKNKIAILIAARSGSKRLPRKHFLKVSSKLRLIDLCVLRLKKVKFTNNIFICTTKKKEDDEFKKICKTHNIKLFRGSTNNVLKRLIDCATLNSVKTIVRITGDCPIIDPKLIDHCLKIHFRKKLDYTTNTLNLSFPDGQDVEIINYDALLRSQKKSKTNLNQEHVTPFIRKSKIFKKYNYKNKIDYSNRRWTLDNYDDYLYFNKVIKFFSPNIFFSWKDLISAEKKNLNLINIVERQND